MTSPFQSQQPAPPSPSYAEKQFLHTREAGVSVPLRQAVVTALVIAGSLSGIILTLSIYNMWFGGIGLSLLVFVIGFFLVMAAFWLFSIRRWVKLTDVERALNMDINQDKVIGEPRTIRVQVDDVRDGGHFHVTQQFDLPFADRIPILAAALLGDPPTPFSETPWAGKGKLFSQPEFYRLQKEMIKRGLLVQKGRGERSGYELSAVGRATMRRILRDASPTPIGFDE